MQLSSQDIRTLCALAQQAALRAGQVISDYPRDKLQINKKAGGASLASQVVTEVDLLSEKAILDAIYPSFQEYDLALLTEETEDDKSRLEKDYFWCIDPLDGTLAYIEGVPGYSVSIALVDKKGVPTLGVVYDPLAGILYCATIDGGAYRNDQPWRVEPSAGDKPLTFINDRSIKLHPRYDEMIEHMQRVSQNPNYAGFETLMMGGAAMNACWTIERSPACYFKLPRPTEGGGSLWDFAASACIVAQAGGIACNFAGDPLDLNRTDSTFMNHEGVIYASNIGLVDTIVALGK